MNKITEPWLLKLFDFIEDCVYAAEDQLFMGVATWDEQRQLHGERHFTVSVNCNDLFYWACADMEDIQSLDDVALLEQAYEDVISALPESMLDKYAYWYQMLYAARKRSMRIQHGWYDKGMLPPELHSLFNSVAGPRESGFGNPKFEDVSAADLPLK